MWVGGSGGFSNVEVLGLTKTVNVLRDMRSMLTEADSER